MRQRLRDFLEGWRLAKPPKRTSRVAKAYRFMLERQQIYDLQRELATARKQLNEGPNEGMAYVWRERLQAAEVGLRRVTKDRARLTKQYVKLYRENRQLKARIAQLEQSQGEAEREGEHPSSP